MPAVKNALMQIYKQQNVRCVICLTGGGGYVASQLLGVCGASSTLLELTIPYHRESLANYLNVSSSVLDDIGYCTHETSEILALKCLERGRSIVDMEDAAKCIGIGCSAAIVAGEPKKGEHRAYLTICSKDGMESYKLLLAKGTRSRSEEDECVGKLIVLAMAKAAKLDPLLQEKILYPFGEGDSLTQVSKKSFTTRESLQALAHGGRINNLVYLPKFNGGFDVFRDMPLSSMLVVPGSFNPVHAGHEQLALAAQSVLERKQGQVFPAIFEISIANADKGAVDVDEIQLRVEQFMTADVVKCGPWNVAVTKAALFVDKAKLFPSSTFVIGADTAWRLVDKKYYDNSEMKMTLSLSAIANAGCSFIVAGRFDEKTSFPSSIAPTPRYVSAAEVIEKLPPFFQSMFTPIEESDFRNDISSSQLRAQMS